MNNNKPIMTHVSKCSYKSNETMFQFQHSIPVFWLFLSMASGLTMNHSPHGMARDPFCDGIDELVAQEWDADRYQTQHSFVYEYGSSLLGFLNPKPGERILDLGCGTGELTHEIARSGALTIGIDSDPQMVTRARAQFPESTFLVEDARSFRLEQPVDAVFSNAALHWVPEAERAVVAIARTLKPDGRFVTEFGGKSNIGKIARYLDNAVGLSKNPWYFPSISEYSSMLERNGLEVTLAHLYDRPTPLNEGYDGLRNWILMFGQPFLEGLNEEQTEAVLVGAEKELRDDLYDGQQWIADYRRIRVVASKVDK